MITLTYYINQYDVPEYGPLSAPIRTQVATPLNSGISSGTVKVQTTFKEMFECNYLKIEQDQTTRYAWITDIQHLSGDRLWQISYQVDALRTYLDRATFGKQFVDRYYTTTNKIDSLIGSQTIDYSQVTVSEQRFDVGDAPQGWRTLAIMVGKGGNTQTLNNSSPVQPSPYAIYLRPYDMRAWTSDSIIVGFFNDLINKEEPTNLVAVYSLPYMQVSGTSTIILERESGEDSYSGFAQWTGTYAGTLQKLLNITLPEVGLPQSERLYTLDIPTAGQIDIPRYMIEGEKQISLERLIDIYSGAATYNLLYDFKPTGLSVTAAPLADIPIAYDGRAQTLAVMRNGTRNSIFNAVNPSNIQGAVSNAGAGFAMGGLPGAAIAVGAGLVVDPLMNIVKRQFLPGHGDIVYAKDGGAKQGGGNAYTQKYEQMVYVVCKYAGTENAADIHNKYGYVHNTIVNIVIPSNGYIKTVGCCVQGNIPKWARDSINILFDSGIRFIV